ncbi:hypothetical protein TTHERM_00794120 (macronuclear) [Tetrahymena thermophila SB210]|uniref:Uncharacterized protein n=1 Tax=Tetrahymena thermophila (strain SB210) TaxID=312017 RepID=Q23W19_TETTS|nr:hypothetical protein TTHERM_00794120 [Tetrahymena thermophila SB210]EAS00686.2 hypothetical protein TTHERM_00794120 [Tetrahymena thermophila SB210]|eukprot:XP_001020931.2 hypothetical protein TTHERM_00794120 [Tetrahymena thermophila SB210]
MFREDQYFEAKVMLRSYKDAQDCIKTSAERKMNLQNYENLVNIIIDAKKNRGIEFKYEEVQKGPKFQNLKEIKLFQFSNFIFKRYMNTFDDFNGDYDGLKKQLNEGLFNMKRDYDLANQKQ